MKVLHSVESLCDTISKTGYFCTICTLHVQYMYMVPSIKCIMTFTNTVKYFSVYNDCKITFKNYQHIASLVICLAHPTTCTVRPHNTVSHVDINILIL